MRALLAVYAAALAAVALLASLGGFLPSWAGVVVAGITALGYWAAWCVLTPHGDHADRVGLAGRSSLAARPEPTIPYQPVAGEPPWHVSPTLENVGGWESGACVSADKVELWPGHDDPYYLPAPPDSPGPASGALQAGPGEPTHGASAPVPPTAHPLAPWPPDVQETRLDLFAARLAARYDDTEFRAGMAADVLAYERAQTAGAWEFIARLTDWADTYLREVREAL